MFSKAAEKLHKLQLGVKKCSKRTKAKYKIGSKYWLLTQKTELLTLLYDCINCEKLSLVYVKV